MPRSSLSAYSRNQSVSPCDTPSRPPTCSSMHVTRGGAVLHAVCPRVGTFHRHTGCFIHTVHAKLKAPQASQRAYLELNGREVSAGSIRRELHERRVRQLQNLPGDGARAGVLHQAGCFGPQPRTAEARHGGGRHTYFYGVVGCRRILSSVTCCSFYHVFQVTPSFLPASLLYASARLAPGISNMLNTSSERLSVRLVGVGVSRTRSTTCENISISCYYFIIIILMS